MARNGRGLAGLALLAVSGLAQAQSSADPDATAQGDVAVTIYNNNLALVQDVRQLSIAQGAIAFVATTAVLLGSATVLLGPTTGSAIGRARIRFRREDLPLRTCPRTSS